MREMQAIVTDKSPMCTVSARQSVCHAGSFGAAFAKSLWPLAITVCKH